MKKVAKLLLTLALIACMFLCLAWVGFRCTGGYGFDNLETGFFENKNVLVIVPHQDDDLNLAGGLIEQYTQAGSRLTLVFCTNGDFEGRQETRFREALAVAGELGIPEENVLFLGFGDQWVPMDHIQNIYNSPAGDLVWTSAHGATETYGTAAKDCYLSLPYTRDAYLASLVRLIEDIRPDTVYATDFDEHPDHRASSLLFEEAMGLVLKENPDYHPAVYKGFCYTTAWEGVSDLRGHLNLLSTKQVTPQPWEIRPYYHWDSRVRMPVYTQGLSRYVTQTASYACLSLYESQGALQYVARVTNSDKVFWSRRTDSVLYSATITLGDIQAPVLNDFKLLDSSDIAGNLSDLGVQYVAGPIHVRLPVPQTLAALGLYDDPDLENNILAGYLEFDDGTTVPFGPLDPTGALTEIPLPQAQVDSVTLHVTDYEGYPGLMEIEAYPPATAPEEGVLMLVDGDDNFVYDYILDPSETSAQFTLYSYPQAVSLEDTTVTLEGDGSFTVQDGKLMLSFPEGRAQCTVTVSQGSTAVTARILKPSAPERLFLELAQMADYRIGINLRVLVSSLLDR